MTDRRGASGGAITPPLKWHGGKHYLAQRIVDLMPPHIHYVEPYGGGLAVLLKKDPEHSEVVNDLDGTLMNFWRVLADALAFPAFERMAQALPFSEPLWEAAKARLEAGCCVKHQPWCVQCAVDFFIHCRQSLAGRRESFAPRSRARTRRGMNEQVSAWLTAVWGLPDVHARLRRVVILSGDAVDVIREEDGTDTLFYLDPPYLPDTRKSPKTYQYEMTTRQHAELLVLVKECMGKFMISGYDSALYRDSLSEWSRYTFDLPNNAAAGKTKRRETEVLWCNF